jgi:two-component system response regulator (stage 0 sporulation protein A)
MIKPVDIEELMFRIDQLREIRNQDDICLAPIQSTSSAAVIPGKEAVSSQEKIVESMIISILNKLGVPTNLQGYRYLLSAIVMLSNDLTLINSVTKNLYADLAAVWGTTPQRIERSIRNAIETTWVRGNIDYISKIFYSDNLSPKIRPSNSEFMIRIVNECWNQSLKTG